MKTRRKHELSAMTLLLAIAVSPACSNHNDDHGGADLSKPSTSLGPTIGDMSTGSFGVENTNALCSNGIDDNGNGLIDCADFDCANNPAVTVCNPEFTTPLSTPLQLSSLFNQSAAGSEAGVAIAWSPSNQLYVSVGLLASGSAPVVGAYVVPVDRTSGVVAAVLLSEPVTTTSVYAGLAVSPDGKYLAAGDSASGLVEIVDLSSATPSISAASHASGNAALAFSADSHYLYAGGTEADFAPPTVLRYDLTGASAPLISAGIASAFQIGDLWVNGNDLVAFVSSDTNGTRASYTELVAPATLAATQQYLYGSSTLGVAHEGQVIAAFTSNSVETIAIAGASIVSVAVHPDGRIAAVLQADGSLTLVDLLAKKVGQSVQAHSGYASKLSFSPDGKTLVTAGANPAFALYALP
jgi:WD40 repeat protein